jgi:hypothetical protein
MTRKFVVELGGKVVMEIADKPGSLISVALREPGSQPPSHPFINAVSRDPDNEGFLRRLLDSSSSTDEFIAKLREHGFDVSEVER